MDLYLLKGPGVVLAALYLNEGDRLEIVRYADDCLGIVRNGKTLGNWEAAERDICWDAFFRLGGLDRAGAELIIVLAHGNLRQDDPAVAALESVSNN